MVHCTVSMALISTSAAETIRKDALMIRKRPPTNPPLEHLLPIPILPHRTKVKHPIILPVPLVQELLGIRAFVAVEPFHTGGGVAHDDELVGDVGEVEVGGRGGVYEAGFVPGDNFADVGCHDG